MTGLWLKQDPRTFRLQELAERRNEATTRAALTGNLRSQVTPTEAGIDLSTVPWPQKEDEPYGYYHGKWTAQLAVHIAETLPDVKPEDLRVLRTAALLHDIGRREDWRKPDPGHAQRSAALADELMKRTEWWAQSALRERVCRTIATHTLEGPPPGDPILISLWDAECLESARLGPKTKAGASILAARTARVLTPWAKNPEHQRRWRDMRGWGSENP